MLFSLFSPPKATIQFSAFREPCYMPTNPRANVADYPLRGCPHKDPGLRPYQRAGSLSSGRRRILSCSCRRDSNFLASWWRWASTGPKVRLLTCGAAARRVKLPGGLFAVVQTWLRIWRNESNSKKVTSLTTYLSQGEKQRRSSLWNLRCVWCWAWRRCNCPRKPCKSYRRQPGL